MDYDSIVKYAQDAFYKSTGQKLCDEYAIDFVRSLMSVRDTELVMHTASKSLIDTILASHEFYNKCVYPCDLVQLRLILEKKTITSLSKVIAFSQSAAEKVIRDQKILIKLNINPCKTKISMGIDSTVVGGCAIFHTNNLEVENLIENIVVNTQDYNVVASVEAIVKETECNCPVYTSSYVHGIDKYKFASKYEINARDFNLFGHVEVATDAEEALNVALQRVWEQHPDSCLIKKPDRYTADFWMKSGFFDQMVKLIRKSESTIYNLKQADASSGSAYGTGGRLSGEGTSAEFHNVKRMQYYSPQQAAHVNIDDEYYVRQLGMLNIPKEREIYNVVAIDGDYVTMKPQKGRTKKIEISLLPMHFVKKNER